MALLFWSQNVSRFSSRDSVPKIMKRFESQKSADVLGPKRSGDVFVHKTVILDFGCKISSKKWGVPPPKPMKSACVSFLNRGYSFPGIGSVLKRMSPQSLKPWNKILSVSLSSTTKPLVAVYTVHDIVLVLWIDSGLSNKIYFSETNIGDDCI
mgnify:CR=1 FL=1